MNVYCGGEQAVMRDTVWAGKVQHLVDDEGVPKGMKQVLEERGINTATLKGADMRIILANHEDFRTEKTIVEHFFAGRHRPVHFIANSTPSKGFGGKQRNIHEPTRTSPCLV